MLAFLHSAIFPKKQSHIPNLKKNSPNNLMISFIHYSLSIYLMCMYEYPEKFHRLLISTMFKTSSEI